MAFKVELFCVFAVLGQSFAGSLYRPKSGCGGRVSIFEDTPIYSSDGTATEINYKPSSIYVENEKKNGGPFIVTSVGSIVPSGIAVASDLGLAGELLLSGEIPYLSAVAFEGQFEAKGSAPVEYGCGDCVAITEQIGAPSYSLQGCGK